MKIFAFHLKVLFVLMLQALLIADLLRFYVFLIQEPAPFGSRVATNLKLRLFEKFGQKFALLNLKTRITHIKSKVHFRVEQIFLFLLK